MITTVFRLPGKTLGTWIGLWGPRHVTGRWNNYTSVMTSCAPEDVSINGLLGTSGSSLYLATFESLEDKPQ